MHRWSAVRLVVALQAVAVLVTAPGASARADEGASGEPVVFEVYEMLCRTAALHDEAERQGVGLVPLITEWRFFDHESGRLDLERYEQNIWTPGRPEQWLECVDYTFGIPEGWTGWVDLDFEQWDPIRYPEEHSPNKVRRRLREYKDLINATRLLRPEAQICLHNMVRGSSDKTDTMAMELEIAILCDATSPSMYIKEGYFQRDWDVHRKVLQRCLEVKGQIGIRVYPVIWNRYRTEPFDLMPLGMLRDHVERILRFEHAGQRVDGILMFGDKEAEHEDSNIDYLKTVARTARRVGRELSR